MLLVKPDQLTFKDNYVRYGQKIGVDLVGSPDDANKPEIAYSNFNNSTSSSGDNHNQILLTKSTDGGQTFSAPTLVGNFNDLPDCAAYQGGQDPGRACVPEKGTSQNSVFRATNYASGGVNPRRPSQVVVTYGSYINRDSNESNGCVPTGAVRATTAGLYTGAFPHMFRFVLGVDAQKAAALLTDLYRLKVLTIEGIYVAVRGEQPAGFVSLRLGTPKASPDVQAFWNTLTSHLGRWGALRALMGSTVLSLVFGGRLPRGELRRHRQQLQADR